MTKVVVFYSTEYYDAYHEKITPRTDAKLFTPEAQQIIRFDEDEIQALFANDDSAVNKWLRQAPTLIQAVQMLDGKVFASEKRKAAVIEVPDDIHWEIAHKYEWNSDDGGFVAEFVRQKPWETYPWNS